VFSEVLICKYGIGVGTASKRFHLATGFGPTFKVKDQSSVLILRRGSRGLTRPATFTPPTKFIFAHSFDGYSTNVQVADLVGGKAMIARASL
jgi:hypothetical protein